MLLPRSVILYLIPLVGGPSSITKKKNHHTNRYLNLFVNVLSWKRKFSNCVKNQIYYFCNVKFRLWYHIKRNICLYKDFKLSLTLLCKILFLKTQYTWVQEIEKWSCTHLVLHPCWRAFIVLEWTMHTTKEKKLSISLRSKPSKTEKLLIL